MKRKKILFIFGTRPEALKMAPVILQARKDPRFESFVCLTAQHREMADQVLRLFKIKPDFDLDIMQPGQTLGDLTQRLLNKIQPVLASVKPDIVLVQGDTTTAFAGAIQSFYEKVSVGHIEAGLRSHDKYQPFPEEINRVLVSRIADFHFCPTKESQKNLALEGIPSKQIFVTGNTVVDALKSIQTSVSMNDLPFDSKLMKGKRLLLITAHRRENFGAPLYSICRAIGEIVRKFPDVLAVYPVHLNPQVQKVVNEELGKEKSVLLIPPVSYEQFTALMKYSHVILTDSGGVQEEAPSFGKPVLVMREVTERPDGVALGIAKLVGTSREKIFRESVKLFSSAKEYKKMVRTKNPYGDGRASMRILDILAKRLPGGKTE